MNVLFWINFAFGVLAVGYGAIVLRGVLRGTLRYKWPIRFLACSLLASLAGLLPFTFRLAPMQQICMLTVYCSAVAITAWLKFHLFEIWRAVFVFSVTAVLYLDVLSGSLQLFTEPRASLLRPSRDPSLRCRSYSSFSRCCSVCWECLWSENATLSRRARSEE